MAQDNRQHTRWACQDFRWPTPADEAETLTCLRCAKRIEAAIE